MRAKRGMTLIEILIGLGVIGLATLGAMRVAIKHRANMEIEQAQGSVDVLRLALEGYYLRYCGTGANPLPSISTLVNEGFLDSANIATNPLGNDFTVSIAWGTPTRLTVQADFLNATNAANWQATFNSTSINASQLRWVWVGGTLDGHGDGESRLYKAMYQSGCN